MFVVTHALLPVIAANGVNTVQAVRRREPAFNGGDLGWIAVFGALPDLAWPHISLAARLSSPTHTVWAALAVIPLAAALFYWRRRDHWGRLTVAAFLAYSLHIACDAISGGVTPLHPWGEPVGVRWVPYRWWLLLDIACGIVVVAQLALNRYLARLPIRTVPQS